MNPSSTSLQDFLLPWISLLVTGFCTWAFYKHVLCSIKSKYNIRKLIKKRQKERENAFVKLESRYPVEDDGKVEKIMALADDELIEALQNRKLKATQVLDAFISKALRATRKFNNVVEFIPQAHIWAAKLDEMKEVKGPLHGLPVSIKENIDIEGTDSTKGFGHNIHKPVDESAVLVKILLELGAIPFCKTNVPQTLMTYGCGNPIFGETKNCLNVDLSPGGSSGGEASLVGSGGSIVGIGTDIGGSCRIPAHFCGIPGFKPTRLRLSALGIRPATPGLVGIAGGPGILARNAKLIAKVFKHLTEDDRQRNYDLFVVPIPWNEKLFSSNKSMRIGYFTCMPYFPTIGDTEKTVLAAKQALEMNGHTLVPFQWANDFQLIELVQKFVYADGGHIYRKIWKDEPIAQAAIMHYFLSHVPTCIRKMIAFFLRCKCMPLFHSTRLAAFFAGGATKSSELWDSIAQRGAALYAINRQWSQLDLDLVLCPSFPMPAIPIKGAGYLTPAVCYTMLWNLFDFPAGVVKFGIESGDNIDGYDHQGDLLLRVTQKNAKKSKGMPISVQLVGQPYQDEIVLRGMEELERLAKK